MNPFFSSEESQNATPADSQTRFIRLRPSRLGEGLMPFISAMAITGLLSIPPAIAATQIVNTPAQAKAFGLESLRKAVQQDGGAPLPKDLQHFVKNREAAIQLGKALFWDMQVGSDGTQSCASCHFHAGADSRAKNQLNPDFLAVFDQYEDEINGYFNAKKINKPLFETGQPNHTLRREDFPFVKTIQKLNYAANGAIEPASGNSNDIAGSMGMLFTFYNGVIPGSPVDSGRLVNDSVWNIGNRKNVRRSVPRNAPSVINAVFNYSNFWDGRANPHFNGQDAFGEQNQSETRFFAVVVNKPTGLDFETVSIEQASLASQAVDPVVSFAEMSFGDPSQKSTTDPTLPNGRSFPEIGKKLLGPSAQTGRPLTPLGLQVVHPEDSILGDLSKLPYRGLNTTYEAMIKAAFVDEYWNSSEAIETPGLVFNEMEYNFSLFFGLSVALYESTLVADRSYFDQWLESGRFNRGFGRKELAGLNLFVNEGQCVTCHAGPELTSASIRASKDGKNLIRAMAMAKGSALYDNGFYNIAVTPTTDDLGRGGTDNSSNPNPLGFARQALFSRVDGKTLPFPILGNNFIPAADEDTGSPVCSDTNSDGVCSPAENLTAEFKRAAVDGAFKTPGLRNSLLTGPYFHNGGMATLRQVVQFYNRGGNFCSFNLKDLDPNIKPLGLSDQQEEELVAFLESLTDPRVLYRQAPFDHPELRVPIDGADTRGTGRLGAVGKRGSHHPLRTYLNLDPNDPIFTPEGTCSAE